MFYVPNIPKTCFVGDKSYIAGPKYFRPQLGVHRLFSDALFPGFPDFSNRDEQFGTPLE
jgi:hypothetical protein